LQGIASYPAPPHLEDRTNRGRYSGSRVDQVSYVLQRAGTFEFPAMEFHWFDLNGKSMRTETLPAITLDIAANPSARVGEPSTEEPVGAESLRHELTAALSWLRENLVWLTLAAALLWSLGWCWRRIRNPLARYFAHRRHQRRFGEPARFRALRQAARRGDQDALVRAFWSWSDHLPGRSPPLTGATLLGAGTEGGQAGASEVTPIWDEVSQARYRDNRPDGVPTGTAAALTKLRKHWLNSTRSEEPAAGGQLNP
ncbi:MAG: hypothetical protein EP301_00125, partial [Gammaproteobacteria bacterium]